MNMLRLKFEHKYVYLQCYNCILTNVYDWTYNHMYMWVCIDIKSVFCVFLKYFRDGIFRCFLFVLFAFSYYASYLISFGVELISIISFYRKWIFKWAIYLTLKARREIKKSIRKTYYQRKIICESARWVGGWKLKKNWTIKVLF